MAGISGKKRALRERLESDIREEMETKRETWRKQIEVEREDFSRSLQRRAGHRSIEIARRMLKDYANSELAGHVAEVFIEQLHNLDDDMRQKLSDAALRTGDPALVESGDKLQSTARRNVTRAIHDCVSRDVDVTYREDDDIVMGLRLTIGNTDRLHPGDKVRRTGRLNDLPRRSCTVPP